MERIIAKLESRLNGMKEDVFTRPEFDPIKFARRIGQIEELGQVIDLIREERRHDEDD